MSASTAVRASAHPSWTGIIEVLVWGLGGAVQWDSDSVVLQLPDHPHPDRVADLDALRLCLGRIGMPVLFDDSRSLSPDAALVEFMRRMVESGLMDDANTLAA